MKILTEKSILDFIKVKLIFQCFNIEDIFINKNNKTVMETLNNRKYQHLSDRIHKNYGTSLDEKLGVFLSRLKNTSDMLYMEFLNPYGDLKYCKFRTGIIIEDKGLYCFKFKNNIQYIGKTVNTFSERVNNGYGNISPKNCYRDGQSTNCRINSNINLLWNINSLRDLSFLICPLSNNKEIINSEKQLINKYKPNWNLQR